MILNDPSKILSKCQLSVEGLPNYDPHRTRKLLRFFLLTGVSVWLSILHVLVCHLAHSRNVLPQLLRHCRCVDSNHQSVRLVVSLVTAEYFLEVATT